MKNYVATLGVFLCSFALYGTDQGSYIQSAKDSSIDMLIRSSALYKAGKLTKDQYVEIALQVSKMADYANQTKEALSPVDDGNKGKKVKPADKFVGVSQHLPYGSPDIDTYIDEQLIKNENKKEDLPLVRQKFKELQSMQKNIGIKFLNLKCATKDDCEAVSFGHKICGGPVSYLVVSKLDLQYDSILSKLAKYTELDDKFQKIVRGFAGTCDYVMPPKLSCESNVCKSIGD